MTIYMHTPSAGGIIVHEGKVLVITSKLRNAVYFPKGTIEPGESIEEAAIREVEEETGYRTRVVRDIGSVTFDFTGKDGIRYRKMESFFLMALADSDEPVKNLQEGEDFENEWLTFEEASERLSFLDNKELLEKARALV